MPSTNRKCLIGGVLCALAGLVTATAPATVGRDFTPPTGFNGLAWGAPLQALGKIKLARANTATDSKGKVTQLRCGEKPEGCANVVENSDQDVAGAGSFAVAEYYREADRNPWAASMVALQSATYLFCDEWLGSTVRVDVKQHLRLCGARIFYRSETGAQLATAPAGFESNHDRLLHYLIHEYGPPDGYHLRQGKITVGPLSENGTEQEPADATAAAPEPAGPGQGVTRYRWCGMRDSARALLPDCAATITLLFNHDTGWGMVLLATDAVYEFAQARHASHDENNELYMALISQDPGKPTHRNANKCMLTTGSLVCAGQLIKMADSERRRFEP